jgi:Mn-dependent DtxR family transcriptional regulator
MHTQGTIDIKGRIVEAIVEEAEPMSIVEIAKKVGISWSTAKTNVLELSQEDRVKVKKYGKNWIVWREKKEEGEIKDTCAKYRKGGF